ncbi:MAG TPA: aminopeptidase P family N-terminal domain-containing protein, partial [Gemmatimonadaceae bacterium]
MPINRRRFLETAALGAGSIAIACNTNGGTSGSSASGSNDLPDIVLALKPMKDGVVPISDDERTARIAKAQKLMSEQKLDAIFMEGTTSCFYYTAMRWGQSERTFGVVIPANGAI